MNWLGVLLILWNQFTWAHNPNFYLLNSGRWVNGYSFMRKVTIDHTKVGSTDSTNFPVLFSGTYAYLKTTGNGGNVTNSNGYDIIFTSDSTGTSKLNFEIETYTASSGAVNFWINVPTVSHTTDTVIYLWYGNSAISTSQQNVSGTWNSAFKGVYHLPNGTSLNVNDSTSNANNGTTVNTPVAATGQIDGCIDFEADSSQKVTVGTSSSLELQDFTISAWVKPESFGGVSTDIIFAKSDSATVSGYQFGLRVDSSQSKIAIAYRDSALRGWYLANTNLSTATWYHIVGVRDKTNGNAIFYLNGASDGTVSATTGTITYAGDTAQMDAQTQNHNYDGLLDELKISNVVRSADWILAEYNNQNSPSTFYTVSNPL